MGTRAVRCVVYMAGSPEAQALDMMVMIRREKGSSWGTAWALGRASASGCGGAVLAIRIRGPYTRRELDTGMVLVEVGAK